MRQNTTSLGSRFIPFPLPFCNGTPRPRWKKCRNSKHIKRPVSHIDLPPAQIRWALFTLISSIFSKFFYLESVRSYFTSYLISKFHVGVQHLFSVAAGTILGPYWVPNLPKGWIRLDCTTT